MAKSKPGFTPSPQDKIDAIEHVVYEYANLISASYHSMNGQAPWRTHSDDAFLLGYRKLRDFLLNDQRGKDGDDVLALDYLPKGLSRVWDLPTWEQEWREHMNKHLTHITYARVFKTREWDHRKWNPKLLAEFQVAWKQFIDVITDVGYRAEFDRQIAHCQGKPGFRNIRLK